jgi:hypothetical protein
MPITTEAAAGCAPDRPQIPAIHLDGLDPFGPIAEPSSVSRTARLLSTSCRWCISAAGEWRLQAVPPTERRHRYTLQEANSDGKSAAADSAVNTTMSA